MEVCPQVPVRRHRGFTLIEVVAALILTGLVAIAIIGYFHQAAFIQERLNGRVAAAIAGEGKLEEILAGAEEGASGFFSPPYAGFSWSAREETMDDGAVLVTVTVEWRDGNVPLQKLSVQGCREPQ